MTVAELIKILKTRDPNAVVFVQREAEWRELHAIDVSDGIGETDEFTFDEIEAMPGVVSFDTWE